MINRLLTQIDQVTAIRLKGLEEVIVGDTWIGLSGKHCALRDTVLNRRNKRTGRTQEEIRR